MSYCGFAFWFFLGGLRGVPASIAGAFLPLLPVFGLAAGYLVGDRLVDRQWLGAALVILAALVAAVHHLTRAPTEGDGATRAGWGASRCRPRPR
jgi:drug/metabolite transporter (DMT)-like permease